MKPMKLIRSVEPGVRSMWAFGLALVVLSLYATTRLPPIGDPIVVDRRAGAPSRPAPGPFVGPAGERQGLAVRSWLSLSSQVTVVLFTRDESAVAFARKLGSRVVVEPEDLLTCPDV